MYNPDFYPEPERFNPDRFLTEDGLRINPNVRNPTTLAFGFGRRFVPTGAIEANFAANMQRSSIQNMPRTFL